MLKYFPRWTEVPKPQDPALLSDWPYQRYGHTVVSKGNTCYLFGGRNDEAACNLLFTFCTKTHTWSRPQVSGDIPGERDGHSAAIIGQHMYVFGGYEVSLSYNRATCDTTPFII